MAFTPLPSLGSTDWYGWATDLETEVSKVAGKADATATLLRWAASTAVVATELRLAPDGKIIQRNANGTTRSTYDSTEQALWTVVSGGGSGGGVSSVNTRTGAVTLTSTDVGLANVNNTSDASKPISTATQAALDALAARVTILESTVVSLNAALAQKADLATNGTLEPAQMPTVNQVVFTDVATSSLAALTYNNGYFVRVAQ